MKKVASVFEMVLMIFSIFAFCYFIGLSDGVFESVSAAEEEDDMTLREFIEDYLGGELTENTEIYSYPISSEAEGAGCCFATIEGDTCATASPENCIDDSPFAEGALCAETSFCEKGCCYDEASGIFDENVLEIACPAEWINDPNCNIPEAEDGCCFLGTETKFETEGQCVTDTVTRALGDDNVVDWWNNVTELECALLANVQEEGACIWDDGSCSFIAGSDCLEDSGEFYVDTLCTSPSLNTTCEMTTGTRCYDGFVYFVDSCDNKANVYDSSRATDDDYWDKVVDPEDLCDEGDGNGDSKSCGNCDLVLGGVCGSAIEDDFDVDMGGYYCRDTSCEYMGETYLTGESWCVYDGAIGDGNDLPGSRHWKYSCSQGVVTVGACQDMRDYICVQEVELDVNGTGVDYSTASCVSNAGDSCLSLNGDEEDVDYDVDGCIEELSSDCGDTELYPTDYDRAACTDAAIAECSGEGETSIPGCDEELNCRVDTVEVSDHFSFDVCLPEYPMGFDLNSEDSQTTAETLCGMADQTCTVVYEPKLWGGCRVVANEECLTEAFAEEMNDFCRGIGDCGGSVNIEGEWSGNYVVRKDGELVESLFLSSSWISKLKDLVNPVEGQYAEVEDYSEYLAAAGLISSADDGDGDIEYDGYDTISNVGYGVGGLGIAAGSITSGYVSVIGGYEGLGWVGSSQASSVLAGFANVAIAAGAGIVIGGMIAKSLDLSEGGSLLMSLGGVLVTVGLASYFELVGATTLIPVGGLIVAAIGAVLMIIASFFGGDDCDPVEVTFECKPWQPPVGGDDCEECNDDPLKPCSEYRCESLGTACTLINVGTEDEMCVDGNPDDITPPALAIGDFVGEGFEFSDTDSGYSVTTEDGDCLSAGDIVTFEVLTDEPAYCKYGYDAGDDFEDLEYDLGGNGYIYEHVGTWILPSVGDGEGQEEALTDEVAIYVKCMDQHGTVSIENFAVEACIYEGPDGTAPEVVASSPEGTTLLSTDTDSKNVVIETNELSVCRWDLEDVEYEDMNNTMMCVDSVGSPSGNYAYACRDTLPFENSTEVTYYFRCMDQPWLDGEGNAMDDSYELVLEKPDSKISIDKIAPSSDMIVGTDSTTIELKIATSGGGDEHFCSYSFTGYDKMVGILEAGTARTHTVTLNRPAGIQNIYVECRDETGDFDRNMTSFEIVQDDVAPIIARVWQDNGYLKLVLLEEGECRYSLDSCQFIWENGTSIGSGTEMQVSVDQGEVYYVKCKDDFENAPRMCSVEVFVV